MSDSAKFWGVEGLILKTDMNSAGQNYLFLLSGDFVVSRPVPCLSPFSGLGSP